VDHEVSHRALTQPAIRYPARAVTTADAHHTELWLLRHGETAWSRSGQYTGRTDLPLTPEGEQQAIAAGVTLRGHSFDRVYTSPLQRARRTAELAGFPGAIRLPEAMEWDYGDYEGHTGDSLRAVDPTYLLWTHEIPRGESLADVAARADLVVEQFRSSSLRSVLLVSHGHFLRILAARWLGLPAPCAQHFSLATARICTLGWDHGLPAIVRWGL